MPARVVQITQITSPTGPPAEVEPTLYRYTGQRDHTVDFGLHFYNARWYEPAISRWIQPDILITDPLSTLDWDRYQYVRSNPVKFNDPSGHMVDNGCWTMGCSSLPGEDDRDYIYNVIHNNNERQRKTRKIESAVKTSEVVWRMLDPVDMVYTGIECLSGNCSVTDIFFAIIPFLNGGLDDAVDAARAFNDATKQAGESIIRAINPPTYRGGLRRSMERLGNNAPIGMLNPQVHHNLPWDFRDWFAGPGRGFDVNDPQFGRWVSGSPQELHQKWSYKYNQAWRIFIRENPNASRQQVLDYLNELLGSGRYPSQ